MNQTPTEQAVDTAEPSAPAQEASPAETLASAVLQAIDAAIPVLEQETALLKAGPRLEQLQPVYQDKETRLDAYTQAVKALRDLPGGRQNLPEPVREQLLEAARRFDAAVRANAKALDIALVTSHKVMEVIMGAARAVRGNVEVYGRRGSYVTPGGVAPVAVDRAL